MALRRADGNTALQLARSFETDVMIVAIALHGHRDRSSSVGFERHLVKPVKVQELLHAIANPPVAEPANQNQAS
jgi:hypothetical protein